LPFLRLDVTLNQNISPELSLLQKEQKEEKEEKFQPEPEQLVVHQGVHCNCCAFPVVGVRYKCVICVDYDLCSRCEALNVHPLDHPMMKIEVPLAPSFQSIHALGAGLHQCRGHLTRAINQPKFSEVAEDLKVLKEEITTQLQTLSEQVIIKANQLKEEIKVKYEEVKSSQFLNDFVLVPRSCSSPMSHENLANPEPVSDETNITTTNTTTSTTNIPTTKREAEPFVDPPQSLGEILFKDQLTILAEMGFLDVPRNVLLLEQHEGDISVCLQHLLE